MSTAVSNLNAFSAPFSSHRGSSTSCYTPMLFSKFPSALVLKPKSSGGQNNSIKAIAGEGRETSHESLQKSTRQQYQQPQKRVAQVTPTGLWDRFPTARTVQQMMDTMERIMEDPSAYNGGSPYPSLNGDEGGVRYRRGRTPWEIKEGEGEYNMRFDMPGMTRRDVKVWVEEKMLVVKAEKLPKENKEGGCDEDEWPTKSYGRYSSRIALPDNVELEKIKAEVKDGVLYITIPKSSPEAKVLDIDVK